MRGFFASNSRGSSSAQTTLAWFDISSSPSPSLWRDGIATAVQDNVVYQIGGWYSGPVLYNQIRKSIDGGITWSTVGDAPWAGRHTFGFGKLSDGYYYLWGGDYVSTATEKKEVWKTNNLADHTSWTLVTNTAAFGERILYGSCVHNDKLYIAGGQVSTTFTDGTFSTIYESSNGNTWTQIATGVAALENNLTGCMASFNGKMWLVCGGHYDTFTYHTDVFSSSDGVTWASETAFPGTAVQYPTLGVWNNKLWVEGGTRSGGINTNQLYYLDTLGVWHSAGYSLHPAGSAIGATHASSFVVYDNTLLRISGNEQNKVYQLRYI